MLTTIVLGVAAGFVLSLVLPALLKPTRFAQRIGNGYFSFVAKSLRRPAVGVGKHGDASLVQLSFDSVYDTETIEKGGVEKKITRTAKNVHRVGTTPFTFFDEQFGVTFDLRDLLIGELEHQHRDDGEMVFTETSYDSEGQLQGMENYVRGFFEVDGRRGVDLDLNESVRPITDGSEEADWWDYMWENVRRMYILRQEDMSILKMILPFAIGAGAFFLGYYLFGPGPMPGTGGQTAPDPVSVGYLVLLISASDIRDRIPWRGIAKTLTTLLAVGVAAAAAWAAGIVTAVLFALGLAVGFAILPVLTGITGAVGYGAALGDLLLWAGLGAFSQPVLDLTEDDNYRFVEADAVGLERYPRVKLAKRLIGLSPEVSPAAFDRAGTTSSGIVEYIPPRDMLADGGGSVIPRGYVKAEGYQRGGHTAFVPREPDEDTIYVRVDTWLRRFKDAATGDAVETAEKEATKEYAAGDAKYSDGELMKYSVYASIAGLGFWGVVALVL